MKTVIDALVVTLGIDNKDFIDKTKMSKKELAEFEKAAKKTAEDVKKHGEKASEFYKGLQHAALAFFAAVAGAGLKSLVHDVSESDKATGRMAKALGIAIEELGTWQNAAVLAGGSAEGFQDSIKAVAGSLVDIEKDLPRANRSMKVFAAAGIKGLAIGKKADVLDVLDQLAAKMKGMGAFEARRLGERMGLDAGTIRLLRQGKDGIAELRKEAADFGVATKQDAENAEELGHAHHRLALAGQSVGRAIAQIMIPAMTFLAEKSLILSKWAAQHSGTVKAVFIGLGAAILVAGAAALAASPPILAISWPVLAVAAAVGLLAAGITWLVLKWKDWIAGGQKAGTTLEKFFTMLKAGWDRIKGVVLTVMSTIWSLVKTYVDILLDEFQLLFAIFTGDWAGAGKAWDKLCKDLVKFFKIAVNLLIFWALVQVKTVVGMWVGMWRDLKAGWKEFEDWISGRTAAQHKKDAAARDKKYAEDVAAAKAAGKALPAPPKGDGGGWASRILNPLGGTTVVPTASQAVRGPNNQGPAGIVVNEMNVTVHDGKNFWKNVGSDLNKIWTGVQQPASHVAQAEGR